jgi:hypothetical protein
MLAWIRRDSFVTHRAFCGTLVEETGRVLVVPVPPSPRPPDLEAEENVDKDKEKRGEEDNENSAVAETDKPPHVEAVTEKPLRILSPPPLPQELQRNPSPPPLAQEAQPLLPQPPLAQEPQPLRSRPPLPQEPPPLCSRPPFLREQQPVVVLVPNVDGMLFLNLVSVLVLFHIDVLDVIYCRFLLL